jgi:hypothetical protein
VQKIGGFETLGRFGMRAFLLDGRDVKSQMHIEGDLEAGLELRWNLDLSCRSNADRTGVVIHKGRYFQSTRLVAASLNLGR